jgi:hypothetical protein
MGIRANLGLRTSSYVPSYCWVTSVSNLLDSCQPKDSSAGRGPFRSVRLLSEGASCTDWFCCCCGVDASRTGLMSSSLVLRVSLFHLQDESNDRLCDIFRFCYRVPLSFRCGDLAFNGECHTIGTWNSETGGITADLNNDVSNIIMKKVQLTIPFSNGKSVIMITKSQHSLGDAEVLKRLGLCSRSRLCHSPRMLVMLVVCALFTVSRGLHLFPRDFSIRVPSEAGMSWSLV